MAPNLEQLIFAAHRKRSAELDEAAAIAEFSRDWDRAFRDDPPAVEMKKARTIWKKVNDGK